MQQTPVIQGGMGVGVSSWRLASAVARSGQTGVVSGTALDVVMARRLQSGDEGGHVRRALARFPFPEMAARILERWFVPGGKPADEPFRLTPMPAIRPGRVSQELTVAANFVEVFLAREGHDGQVGINFLEKIQPPTLFALYGALLGGVGVVIMGAGIPRAIPGAMDLLAAGREARLPISVAGTPAPGAAESRLDPAEFCGGPAPQVARPAFLPIVSSATLADVMVRKSSGRIDGFVVEGPTAGGHNAPPRGEMQLSAAGEPVYGERDRVDLGAFRRLGKPFWLAGSQASAERLATARAEGASGIQVGTAFAFCAESGVEPELKARVIDAVRAGTARVRTDPRASPTGFPFKVLELPGTAGDRTVTRERICDLGFLRQAYSLPDGSVAWRCPGEPLEDYVRKGGLAADAEGRICVCNGLIATIGLPQVRDDGRVEPPLVTSGDEIAGIARFLRPGTNSYSAQDVLDALLTPA